jgi:hypothetical protein
MQLSCINDPTLLWYDKLYRELVDCSDIYSSYITNHMTARHDPTAPKKLPQHNLNCTISVSLSRSHLVSFLYGVPPTAHPTGKRVTQWLHATLHTVLTYHRDGGRRGGERGGNENKRICRCDRVQAKVLSLSAHISSVEGALKRAL